ncbi:hypothetical protein [Enterococcus villorum]|uniref:hypothetical protein n=1 Tax=Enterococcus villorum TaxID=112904 RepID=UPI0015C4611A|nr:hypothetical protein [Enterococcus villorum]
MKESGITILWRAVVLVVSGVPKSISKSIKANYLEWSNVDTVEGKMVFVLFVDTSL